ncbi:MAG: hypothetical protein WC444_06695 [Candidatus Paceibacterota bacterium]
MNCEQFLKKHKMFYMELYELIFVLTLAGFTSREIQKWAGVF